MGCGNIRLQIHIPSESYTCICCRWLSKNLFPWVNSSMMFPAIDLHVWWIFSFFPYVLMILPWFSHDFAMIFSWFSHDVAMIFSWFCHDFLMIFSWFSHDFAMIFSWCCHDFAIFSNCFWGISYFRGDPLGPAGARLRPEASQLRSSGFHSHGGTSKWMVQKGKSH